MTAPTAGPCDSPLVCVSINQQYIPFIAGAMSQLTQRTTWTASSEDELQAILANMTWAIELVGTAVQCGSVPLPPTPTPATQACNIAGYLSNFVIREAILQAVQAAQQDLSILSFANQLISWIPGISFWYIIFSSTIINWLSNIVHGTLSDYEAALTDDLLWQQVTCKIYACIAADGKVTTGNFGCIQTALCSLTYPLSDVKSAICDFISGMGADQIIAAQTPGAAVSYTCNCGSGTAVGPGGLPPRVTSGTQRVLIAAGQAIGSAAVTLLKSYATNPVLVPGGNNPIMIPSFTSVTPNSFTVEVEAPRAVDVDTYVDIDWVATPPGLTP